MNVSGAGWHSTAWWRSESVCICGCNWILDFGKWLSLLAVTIIESPSSKSIHSRNESMFQKISANRIARPDHCSTAYRTLKHRHMIIVILPEYLRLSALPFSLSSGPASLHSQDGITTPASHSIHSNTKTSLKSQTQIIPVHCRRFRSITDSDSRWVNFPIISTH